jgi:hypothetical protein
VRKNVCDRRVKLLLAALQVVIGRRWIVLDGRRFARSIDELGKVVFKNAVAPDLGQTLAGAGTALLVGDVFEQFFRLKAGIPHRQGPHLAELGHVFAIGADASQNRFASVAFTESVAAAGEDEAGGQAFDIPFPRSGERFVQVVDVEDDSPFRRGEATEVPEVGVTAGLHAQARRRRAGQVHGHVERRPAIKSERRWQHAPMAQRNQLGQTPPVGFFDQSDRIGPVRRRCPNRVRAARAPVPHGLALRQQLRPRGAGRKLRRLLDGGLGVATGADLGHD